MKSWPQAFWHSTTAKGWTCSVVAHAATFGALLAFAGVQVPQQSVKFSARQSVQVTLTSARPAPPVRRAELPVELSVNVSPSRARVARQRFVFEPSQTAPTDKTLVHPRTDASVPARQLSRRESQPLSEENSKAAVAFVEVPSKTAPELVALAQTAASTPVTSGQTSLPHFVDNPPPVYPSVAIARGWEGRVLLRLFVSAEGRVQEVEVLESSGFPVLDAAAVTAVRKWRATPGHAAGRPVESSVQLPVRFELP